MVTVFTMGYGGRTFDQFVSMLKEHGICCLVDVRRFPRSTVTDYDKQSLEAKLPHFGIRYAFMGDTLGGLRREGYHKHMESDAFQIGIRQLLQLARNEKTVLMCKERDDSRCHRRFIIQALRSLGVSAIAIQ